MYLQLDTRFNPFTYDELVKPLLHYKEAYDATEAAYSDLAMQTEAFRDMVNRENSPEAYEMFQRYSGDLNNAVEDFSRGMTASNRRALIGMKRRYASDISPIARASEAMNAANELRFKAGPDAIFEVGEYNSLDQFLHGKTANNKYQSREALTKKTAALTEAVMAEAMKDPEFKKAMGDQYWMITQHTGGSYTDLMEALKLGMMDNPIAQNRFSEIRQRVLSQSGIENYDAAGQAAIIDAINTGLYVGLDKPANSLQANQDHITPLQRMAHSGGGGGGRGGSGRYTKSGGGGGDDDTDDLDTYTANDVIYENGGNGRWSVPKDMEPSELHGYRTNYESLGRETKRIVDQHIGDSDPRQYEYYTWRASSTGRDRVQIVRKQPYTKPGASRPGAQNSASDAYLND